MTRLSRGTPAVVCAAAVALALGCRASTAAPPRSGGAGGARAIAAEVERLAAQGSPWPGFDPMRIPLAIFDGERTYLFHHPSPPEGFAPPAGPEPEAAVFEGRHPAVTSNSSAAIGGVETATLTLGEGVPAPTLTQQAAVALHEAFHVYQRERHPGWRGNEGDLFLYPSEDAELLAWRRLETEALRRALAESSSEDAACWAGVALENRGARFAAMESAFAEYERKTELNEGLASYIQMRAEGKGGPELPAAGFAASEVRLRAYQVGPALALLSDRLAAGWKESLESGGHEYLEDPLRAALAKLGPSRRCAFSASETSRIERTAQADAARVARSRRDRRDAFEARPGWRVVVEAAQGEPLWPQGFDPLNVERVDGGLLHLRFLRLGNDSGKLELLRDEAGDVQALTEAVGSHPLFSGVGRVTVSASARSEWETEGGRLTLRSPGLKVDCGSARLTLEGREVRILLLPKQ